VAMLKISYFLVTFVIDVKLKAKLTFSYECLVVSHRTKIKLFRKLIL
jgi:hypothetical protein